MAWTLLWRSFILFQYSRGKLGNSIRVRKGEVFVAKISIYLGVEPWENRDLMRQLPHPPGQRFGCSALIDRVTCVVNVTSILDRLIFAPENSENNSCPRPIIIHLKSSEVSLLVSSLIGQPRIHQSRNRATLLLFTFNSVVNIAAVTTKYNNQELRHGFCISSSMNRLNLP